MPMSGPAERLLATLDVRGAAEDGAVTEAMVAVAGRTLGLEDDPADHVARAARAVVRGIVQRGFDDPDLASVAVSVLRRGHRVVVHLDDPGLPFNYGEEESADGSVLSDALVQGWIDSIHHRSRGRDGNRTTLVRHLDPGPDLRETADEAEHAATVDAPPASADVSVAARIATPDDVEAICRLCWRTYGYTYQHEEYYFPDRLRHLIESGEQVSIVTETDDALVVGHSAFLSERPDAVVVEAGRAMVDPRYRGHHLMKTTAPVRDRWFDEHGIIALLGAAVTAHTRSQRDDPSLAIYLAYLPPIDFVGIDGTDTDLREAVAAAFIRYAAIPAQDALVAARDAAMIRDVYDAVHLDRRVIEGDGDPPDPETSRIDVSVHADLGHAILTATRVGRDLGKAVAERVGSIRRGGVEVIYLDLPVDGDAATWAVEQLRPLGFGFAGVVPLVHDGVDVVRYQSLGRERVDPDRIKLRNQFTRDLLVYVLSEQP